MGGGWGRSFSYISRAGFIFIVVVCLTHPVLAQFNFIRGLSLTQPMLASFLSREFILHIPCWFYFYAENLSYTSYSAFMFVQGVCLTHPVLPLILSGKFLLHIPSCLYFYVGSFSYTSHAGLFYAKSLSYISQAVFIFMWGISLTHPELSYVLCGEFLLHIPSLLFISVGSLSYTSWVFCFLSFSLSLSLSLFWDGFTFMRIVSLTHPVLASSFLSFFIWEFITHPALALFLCGEFLLHILCLFYFYVGSFSDTSHAGFFFFFFLLNLWNFSYTSRAGFIFMRGVSLTNPVLALFLSGEFVLHIPCLLFISVGSLSYTSLAGFSPPLSLLSWLHFYAGSFSYTSRAGFFSFSSFFFFIWGVSFTHPALALFFGGEFLLHIPCLFDFSVGSFSYRSRVGFIFMRGVSLKHPVLALFLSGEFLLHIPCLLLISVGSLSYTSWVGSLSLSLATTRLASFLCGEFLLHIPCWLFFFFFLSGQLLLRILRWLYFSMGNLCYTSHACLIFSVGSFSYTSHADFFFFFFFLSGEFL